MMMAQRESTSFLTLVYQSNEEHKRATQATQCRQHKKVTQATLHVCRKKRTLWWYEKEVTWRVNQTM